MFKLNAFLAGFAQAVLAGTVGVFPPSSYGSFDGTYYNINAEVMDTAPPSGTFVTQVDAQGLELMKVCWIDADTASSGPVNAPVVSWFTYTPSGGSEAWGMVTITRIV
jgi:hypothetical protein